MNIKTASQIAAEEKAVTPYQDELKTLMQLPALKDFKAKKNIDPVQLRLQVAQHLLQKSDHVSLKPLLPLLLTLRGKPYHLDDHFPFAPFFRTRMPRKTLLKTGRQVSKSSSLAAQGLLFANSIPYFTTLYLTPLFEMIRRFSQNYVAPLIEGSPIGRMFTGTDTVNNVLQRSFKNKAKMIFSFAYLDAERTRGISADKNCLVAGTPITLADGSDVAIEKAQPGMPVLATDKNGIIVEDIITEVLNQGYQHVFEVRFFTGQTLQCTADERFRSAADKEWYALSDLVREVTEISQEDLGSRFAKASIGRTFDLTTTTANFGLLARGRRDNPVQRNIQLEGVLSPRTEAESLLRIKSEDTGQPGGYTRKRSRKSRLRQGICDLRNRIQRIAARNRRTDNGERQETSQSGVVGSVDLGIHCLLVHGRRQSGTKAKQCPIQHAWVLGTGVRNVGTKVTRTESQSQSGTSARQEDRKGLSHHPRNCRRSTLPVATNSAVGASDPCVQTGKSQRVGHLLRLRHDISWATRPSRSQKPGLPGRGMRSSAPSSSFQGISRTQETCAITHITSVRYVGVRQTWDINTRYHHSFFAKGVNLHNCIDEIQDMDISFLPVIHETISASVDWGIIQYAGTPKTLDNTIERLWTDTSQAEWIIKCRTAGCGHWNIPALEFDLVKMIGPYHSEISEETPGVVCSKCQKPLNPRPFYQGGTGRWLHRYKDLRWDFAGFHVPQIVMPMHYAQREKWALLRGKMEGKNNTPLNVFYNEVCGESYDSGAKLITLSELRAAASLPWPRDAELASRNLDYYTYRFVAVDWGGGGVNKGKSDMKFQSYTTVAVCGLAPNGQVHVIYGYRSNRPFDHLWEAKLIMGIFNQFRCSHLVHDYTGAGTVRETVLHQAGFPLNRLIPVAYTGPAKGGLVVYKEPTDSHPRAHYVMDRNRALNYVCQFIKSGVIKFFQYDYKGNEDPGLIRDFLNLIEDKKESGAGRDFYKILRDPAGPDDFAQAVTIGTLMLFQMRGVYPDLSAYADIAVPPELESSLKDQLDWFNHT